MRNYYEYYDEIKRASQALWTLKPRRVRVLGKIFKLIFITDEPFYVSGKNSHPVRPYELAHYLTEGQRSYWIRKLEKILDNFN